MSSNSTLLFYITGNRLGLVVEWSLERKWVFGRLIHNPSCIANQVILAGDSGITFSICRMEDFEQSL